MINSTLVLVVIAAVAAIVAHAFFQWWRAAQGAENPHTLAPAVVPPGPLTRLRADFNGVLGQLLCLSHEDYGLDEAGQKVWLREDMAVLAWEEDGRSGGPLGCHRTGPGNGGRIMDACSSRSSARSAT